MQKMRDIRSKQGDYQSGLPASSSWFTFFVTDMFGRNYLNLKGRASRSEWWGFTILGGIFSIFVNVLYAYFGLYVLQVDFENPDDFAWFNYGGVIISFLLSIPSVSLSFRRFHDINMSAWWGMLIIPMFFLPFFRGDCGDNRFGKSIYV